MYTPTPDFYNDYLAHYGIKGMKWKNHIYKTLQNLKGMYGRTRQGLIREGNTFRQNTRIKLREQ